MAIAWTFLSVLCRAARASAICLASSGSEAVAPVGGVESADGGGLGEGGAGGVWPGTDPPGRAVTACVAADPRPGAEDCAGAGLGAPGVTCAPPGAPGALPGALGAPPGAPGVGA